LIVNLQVATICEDIINEWVLMSVPKTTIRWVVNLRATGKEDIMKDAYLKGFGEKSEELRKAWEGHKMEVDVSEELHALLKVYTDAEEHLKSKEMCSLDAMTIHMKRYLEIREERMKVTSKLASLKKKIATANHTKHDNPDEGHDE
jgi:hypothetical protein